ncbi:hypothetical protein BLOT_012321, partial [Blomia tropicalis]
MSQVTRYNLWKDSPETGNSGVATYFSISKCFHAHDKRFPKLKYTMAKPSLAIDSLGCVLAFV